MPYAFSAISENNDFPGRPHFSLLGQAQVLLSSGFILHPSVPTAGWGFVPSFSGHNSNGVPRYLECLFLRLLQCCITNIEVAE